MRLEQLEYLCAVTKNGSINASAEKLHVSQQNINVALKNLEKEVGYPLFSTSNRGIQLTEEGILVANTAEDILNRWSLLKETLSLRLKPTPQISGHVVFQATPSLFEFFVLYHLEQFYSQYPKITLQLTSGEHVTILQSLEKGTADIGLMGIPYTLCDEVLPELKAADNIKFVPLYQCKNVIIASSRSPIAKYKSVSMKTILKYPIVLPIDIAKEDCLNYRWLSLYGTPKVKVSTTSPNIYRNIIRHGLAIGIYPSLRHCGINLPLENDLRLIPINNEGSVFTIGYLYNTSLPVTPAMQAFFQIFNNICERPKPKSKKS